MRYASNPTADAALDSDIAARTHTSRRKQCRWITQIIFPHFFLFCDNADPSQSVIGDFTPCPSTVSPLLSYPSYPGAQAWCDPRTHATRAKEDQCSDPLRLRPSLLFFLSLSGPPSFSLVHLAANGNSIQKFGQGQIVQEVHTHTHAHRGRHRCRAG